MATDGSVARTNGVTYDAAQERRLAAVKAAPGGSGPFATLAGRRVNGVGLAVSVGGSPESVTVTPGAGTIYDPIFAGGGYDFEIPASVNLSLPARPSSGQSRIDLIVARVYDPDIGLGSVREVKIERVGGSPAASPSTPSAPAGSLALATLTVPNSGSITVTSSTARSVAAGGIIPVATTAFRDNLAAYAGMSVWNAQTSRMEVYTGSAWAPIAGGQFVRHLRTSNQPISSSSNTGVYYSTADVPDTSLWTVGSSSPWPFTCVRAGVWRVTFSVRWDANATGRRGLYVFVNGSQTEEGNDSAPGAAYFYRQQVVIERRFSAGDTVGAQVFQSSGGTLNIVGGTASFSRVGD